MTLIEAASPLVFGMDPKHSLGEPFVLQAVDGSVEEKGSCSIPPMIRVHVDGEDLTGWRSVITVGRTGDHESDDNATLIHCDKPPAAWPTTGFEGLPPHPCPISNRERVEIVVRHQTAPIGDLPGPNMNNAQFVGISHRCRSYPSHVTRN